MSDQQVPVGEAIDASRPTDEIPDALVVVRPIVTSPGDLQSGLADRQRLGGRHRGLADKQGRHE